MQALPLLRNRSFLSVPEKPIASDSDRDDSCRFFIQNLHQKRILFVRDIISQTLAYIQSQNPNLISEIKLKLINCYLQSAIHAINTTCYLQPNTPATVHDLIQKNICIIVSHDSLLQYLRMIVAMFKICNIELPSHAKLALSAVIVLLSIPQELDDKFNRIKYLPAKHFSYFSYAQDNSSIKHYEEQVTFFYFLQSKV